MLPWEARTIADAVTPDEALPPPDGCPNWTLGNHDEPAIAGRVGRTKADPSSMLTLFRRLIVLRWVEPAHQVRSFEPVKSTDDVLAHH